MLVRCGGHDYILQSIFWFYHVEWHSELERFAEKFTVNGTACIMGHTWSSQKTVRTSPTIWNSISRTIKCITNAKSTTICTMISWILTTVSSIYTKDHLNLNNDNLFNIFNKHHLNDNSSMGKSTTTNYYIASVTTISCYIIIRYCIRNEITIKYLSLYQLMVLQLFLNDSSTQK